MKFIISHDVDHLYGRDHWLRDLIYPKLWIKNILHIAQRKITVKEAWLRGTSCFQKNRHCLEQVMSFDRKYGVPSAFFFGMNQGLGMSYYPEEAKPAIQMVHDGGFAVGVHGIEYDSAAGIDREYHTFNELMGFEPCGIRMHYVRFCADTLRYEDEAGYVFDSSEFDKKANGTIKAPYKQGNIWEFPLTIMDGYLTQDLEKAKKETLERLQVCREQGMEYVSVLFHDYQFNDGYTAIRDWYKWLIQMIAASETDSFISYEDAIKELEAERCQK